MILKFPEEEEKTDRWTEHHADIFRIAPDPFFKVRIELVVGDASVLVHVRERQRREVQERRIKL
jgi:hypothetical protein